MKKMSLDNFKEYAKEKFGCDVYVKSNDELDAFESIFGVSFLNDDERNSRETEKPQMTIEEAIRILDPKTSADAIAEIEYYAGFNRDKAIEKVNEACIIACYIMRMYIASRKENDMVWNVYYHDFNTKKIIHWNIFKHGTFRKEVCDLLNSDLTKEDFAKRLERSLIYYFWSKTGYEVLISPWVGEADDVKIDIYDQVMMNWYKFLDYVWSFRKEE